MKVFDIMSEHIVTVGLSEPVTAAARLLKPKHRLRHGSRSSTCGDILECAQSIKNSAVNRLPSF